MQMKRITGWIGAVAIGTAVACSSAGRTDYFTFRLEEYPVVSASGLDTTFVAAYVYVPWGPEPLELTAAPCWLAGFDLRGKAISEIGGNRVTDDADQPAGFPGTYVQYASDENGELLPASCPPFFDGRFLLDGDLFLVGGAVIRAFPDPGAISIPPGGEGSYLSSDAGWSIEGASAVNGELDFWPYEYSPAAPSALRLYPTEPGR